MQSRPRLHRALLSVGASLLGILLLPVLCIALFGWNWLRSPLERVTLKQTGRVLALQGDLKVSLAWPAVRLSAAQVVFANPAWTAEPRMLSADGVTVTVDVNALLKRQLVFPDVTLDRARVFLEQTPDGRKSWLLDLKQTDEAARIHIGRVALNQGTLGFDDAGQNTHIRAALNTLPAQAAGLQFKADGLYKGLPLQLHGSGGPVLALRDITQPYPLALEGSAGKTEVTLQGSVTGLLTLTAVDVHMRLRGPSLEALYPLLGIPFPATRNYVTQGQLRHTGSTWRYEQFTGKLGNSDLAGFVEVTTSGNAGQNAAQQARVKRPVLTADLHSALLDLDDLGPVIGSRPAKPNTVPQPQQRVLPDVPFNTARWNAVDADVHFHAKRIRRNTAMPLDKLASHLVLRDAVLTLDPITVVAAGGQVNATITLDGRSNPIKAHAQVRARKVLLAQLFPAFKLGNSSIGQVNGNFDLTGSGNSVGTMLANANGKLGLVVNGGQVSQLMMEKAGLHLWEILNLTLAGDKMVKLRCAVADFNVTQGIMQAQALVFDTQVTTLMGTGSIDLKQEQLNLTLNPKTKVTSPLALRSPIYVRGSFGQPQVSVDKGRVATRAAGAVALALVNPLLALIPLIDPGPGVDSDCRQLVHDAKARPNALQSAPPP